MNARERCVHGNLYKECPECREHTASIPRLTAKQEETLREIGKQLERVYREHVSGYREPEPEIEDFTVDDALFLLSLHITLPE